VRQWNEEAVKRQKPKSATAALDFQANEHEEAAAEFGPDDEGPEPRIDAARLHIVDLPTAPSTIKI
jgi:hypothetical protein